ncbi:MAG: pyridoxamine 5'-phosphate oxidase family protein [Ilumatobacteraceae bacterium]
MSDETMTIDDLRNRLTDVRVAMVTTIDAAGLLSSRPLTVQRIDDAGNAYFIVPRGTEWAIDTQAVNVALVDEGRTWVSIVGRAEYVEGTSLLSDLWDPATDALFPDGQSSAVAMQVHAERWEYWTAPNKFGQMAKRAKAFLMDTPADLGDSGTVPL